MQITQFLLAHTSFYLLASLHALLFFFLVLLLLAACPYLKHEDEEEEKKYTQFLLSLHRNATRLLNSIARRAMSQASCSTSNTHLQ